MSRNWKREYGAYLFDLDGTLVDTAPDLNIALNHCLSNASLPPVPETLTRHWVGHGARVLIQQAIRHTAGHTKIDPNSLDVAAMYEQFLHHYYEHGADASRPYPFVFESLDILRQRNCQLAVVTNKLEHLSRKILQQLQLLDYFDVVVGGDTTSHPKPDPAPIYHCLEALSAKKEDALFVGDSQTDVDAAINADVTVVCLRHGYNHGIDVETLNANGLIDDFSELV